MAAWRSSLLQFANLAQSVMRFEHLHYVVGNQIDGFVQTHRKLVYEMLHQQRDVLDPFADSILDEKRISSSAPVQVGNFAVTV
jgi:hypothetical protein